MEENREVDLHLARSRGGAVPNWWTTKGILRGSIDGGGVDLLMYFNGSRENEPLGMSEVWKGGEGCTDSTEGDTGTGDLGGDVGAP